MIDDAAFVDDFENSNKLDLILDCFVACNNEASILRVMEIFSSNDPIDRFDAKSIKLL